MARSVYYQGRCGSRNNRRFCSLQHPVHHWSVRDLRWAGKRATVSCLFIWQTLKLEDMNPVIQYSCYRDTSAALCVQQPNAKMKDGK